MPLCVFATLSFACLFRYSSINEINKLTQQDAGSKVFVYFITRLPRMEGGTSYIGFHGGMVTVGDIKRNNIYILPKVG